MLSHDASDSIHRLSSFKVPPSLLVKLTMMVLLLQTDHSNHLKCIGRVVLEESYWKSRIGRVVFEESYWKSRIGRVVLKESYWKSRIGRVVFKESYLKSRIRRVVCEES